MRALAIIPTYNEAANVEPLLRAIRIAAPDVEVLVVDDASPDGTADRVAALAGELGGIEVLRRSGKAGLGSAYRDGFARALASGHDVVIQMDADLSHDPAALPALLAAVAAGADLAVGSRYVPGGSTPNWPVHRRVLSRSGNRWAAFVLGLPVGDATSGFRAWRAPALAGIQPETTHATGYSFLVELVRRLVHAGGTVAEVPITFRDRVRGTSKMSVRIIGEAMLLVTWWGLRDRLRPAPALVQQRVQSS